MRKGLCIIQTQGAEVAFIGEGLLLSFYFSGRERNSLRSKKAMLQNVCSYRGEVCILLDRKTCWLIRRPLTTRNDNSDDRTLIFVYVFICFVSWDEKNKP